MYDPFNRKINYLRISVTDRCNLRCAYCMPEEGIQLKNHSDILSFEEIVEVLKVGISLGIEKIRLTGGEPLVRKGIVDLIEKLVKIEGLKDIGLTTNGVLLSKLAKDLKQAGLKRINISLDTINPEKYRKITRIGNLSQVIDGILLAKELGFDPIKINFVRQGEVNAVDEKDVKQFCKKNGFQIRYIRQMNLADGQFYPVEGGEGGLCKICNRLRLTADGQFIPCLFSNKGFSIKKLGIKNAFHLAVRNKPKSGKVTTTHQFYNIGG